MWSSFEIIDFSIFELNFLRNMRIFKKNSAKKMGKSIFLNLMSSTPFGYTSYETSIRSIYGSVLPRLSRKGWRFIWADEPDDIQ